MSYNVEVTESARRRLGSLPSDLQRRLKPIIYSLRENPRPPGAIKMRGAEKLYRMRSGDFRIVYTIVDDRLLVLVLTIAPRDEAYSQKETRAVRKMLKDWLRVRRSPDN